MSQLTRTAAIARIRAFEHKAQKHIDDGEVLDSGVIAAVTDAPAEVLIRFEETVHEINRLIASLKEDENTLSAGKSKQVTVSSLRRISVQEYAGNILRTGQVQGWEELAPDLYVSAALQLVRAKQKLYSENQQELERTREQILSGLGKLREHIDASLEHGLRLDSRVSRNLRTIVVYLISHGTIVGRDAKKRQQRLQQQVVKILDGRDLRAVFRALANAYLEELRANSVSAIAKGKDRLRKRLARELVVAFNRTCRELRRARYSEMSRAIAGLHFVYACHQHADVGWMDVSSREYCESLVAGASPTMLEAAVGELLNHVVLTKEDFSRFRYHTAIRQAFLTCIARKSES